jgi:hypothetical protein
MPPIVLDPPNNGFTNTASYNFNPTNAHGIHSATPVARWKVTVTTAQSNGGTLVTQTQWFTTPIASCPVNSLPANNNFYWGQIVYEKPIANGGGTFVSNSNQFQSRH